MTKALIFIATSYLLFSTLIFVSDNQEQLTFFSPMIPSRRVEAVPAFPIVDVNQEISLRNRAVTINDFQLIIQIEEEMRGFVKHGNKDALYAYKYLIKASKNDNWPSRNIDKPGVEASNYLSTRNLLMENGMIKPRVIGAWKVLVSTYSIEQLAEIED